MIIIKYFHILHTLHESVINKIFNIASHSSFSFLIFRARFTASSLSSFTNSPQFHISHFCTYYNVTHPRSSHYCHFPQLTIITLLCGFPAESPVLLILSTRSKPSTTKANIPVNPLISLRMMRNCEPTRPRLSCRF